MPRRRRVALVIASIIILAVMARGCDDPSTTQTDPTTIGN